MSHCQTWLRTWLPLTSNALLTALLARTWTPPRRCPDAGRVAPQQQRPGAELPQRVALAGAAVVAAGGDLLVGAERQHASGGRRRAVGEGVKGEWGARQKDEMKEISGLFGGVFGVRCPLVPYISPTSLNLSLHTRNIQSLAVFRRVGPLLAVEPT